MEDGQKGRARGSGGVCPFGNIQKNDYAVVRILPSCHWARAKLLVWGHLLTMAPVSSEGTPRGGVGVFNEYGLKVWWTRTPHSTDIVLQHMLPRPLA